jgi:isoleucyl-tRNA synthetase
MSQKDAKHSYKDTLNLPNTTFSMKADLVQREPIQRKAWAQQNIYAKILESRKDAPLYILHDGPPYANGDIHMGHVVNKTLKDFVVKVKTMEGFRAPYVPGWDCHGLPIEAKVTTELGEAARTMDKPAIRKKCYSYAMKYLRKQVEQFQSLGIFGDFEHPYLTMDSTYEQGILEVFAELVSHGLVYKQLRPIHWSVGCETALADAELEYEDISSPSIFVNFPVRDESLAALKTLGLATDPAAKPCFMIWTTTPWTLAANLAVAVHPHLDYVGVTYTKDGQKWTSIVANERVAAVVKAAGLKDGEYQTSPTVRGKELKGLRYHHPFIEINPTDKDAWFVINAEFVTIEDGTGIVHIAPGHGVEDYLAGRQNGLAIYSPVGNTGAYDNTVPEWLRGKKVLQVDREVNDHLRKIGLLVRETQIVHSYPHCWRSKMPVIFRATEQWFIGVDRKIPKFGKSLRQLALDQIGGVEWIPGWGEKRLRGMLESRPDWCISRQRAWGLPIPVFVNAEGKPLLTRESVLAVSQYIGQKGSNSWFSDTPRQILGDGFVLPEGFSWDTLKKEEDIFDVWFEAGSSWYTVADKAGWPIPVDMYLEGSDQHRGWFQLSLLPALGVTGKPPFRSVLTHGFVVDEKGVKQSKSLGNYVIALDEIHKYGADILRLWVASVNYQEDVRCNDDLIGRLQDAYRKIRNTIRYLLSNIDDFDPMKTVGYDQMPMIDRWAMQQLQKLIAQIQAAYDGFAFHRVFSLIYNFCTVEMSNLYLDVLKDRLYCDRADSLSRRSAQTVMSRILGDLVRMLAPILVHTAEEAWAAMKLKPESADSVHLAHLPKPDPAIDTTKEDMKWSQILSLRDEVLRVLEGLRKDQVITSNQEAAVEITLHEPETIAAIEWLTPQAFAALCITSEVTIRKGADFAIRAGKSPHAKCQRCWNFWPSVGTIDQHPDLCQRCAETVGSR